jgi:hypothetical protein
MQPHCVRWNAGAFSRPSLALSITRFGPNQKKSSPLFGGRAGGRTDEFFSRLEG